MLRNTHSEQYVGDKGSAYFAWQNIGGDQRGRINSRKFQQFIALTDKVLDFGCGNGSLLSSIQCAYRVGVEINPAARNEAQKHPGLDIHETLSTVPDAVVDVVVSNHALEHVLSPADILWQLREKLVLGGKLVLCLPIDDWRTQRVDNPVDINHHLYTWTPLLLGHLLRETGYRVERVWVYYHAWPPQHWQSLDARLPVWLFDIVCRFTAWRLRRRQIMAVAVRSDRATENT